MKEIPELLSISVRAGMKVVHRHDLGSSIIHSRDEKGRTWVNAFRRLVVGDDIGDAIARILVSIAD